MKILNVIMCIDPYTGGGSVERICQLSKYIGLHGHTCTLLTTKKGFNKSRAEKLGSISIVALPYISDRFIFPLKLITWLFKNVKNYDVVHLSMNWSAITAITFIYLKLANKPFYFSAMGWLRIEGRSVLLKHIYRVLITLPLIRSAKKCIAVSKREVSDYIANGVSSEKIVYIPNGIEGSEFEKDDGGALFRKKYNIDKRPIIFFIGRIDLIKGPDILLRAFGKICNDFSNYQLIIAGNELGYLSTIKSECKALKLENKVTFLGPIIGEDKVSAYHSAKLVVIPSRFDSMTVVALEAAASSSPILITKECDFSELALASAGIEVNANETEVEEGIRLALSSKIDLEKLGNNAKKFVLKNYDWNIIAHKFINQFSK
jgi:glycosyltransferase involved in cell wall biosynthesis